MCVCVCITFVWECVHVCVYCVCVCVCVCVWVWPTHLSTLYWCVNPFPLFAYIIFNVLAFEVGLWKEVCHVHCMYTQDKPYLNCL